MNERRSNPSGEGRISWWQACVRILIDPHSLFEVLSSRRFNTTMLVFPSIILITALFASGLSLFSDNELVDDLLKAGSEEYESDPERQAAEDRHEAIERALERPGMATILSLRNVWVSASSLLSFGSLFWILLGSITGSWAGCGKWCGAATLSTVVLSFGTIVNTLLRLAFRRTTATVSVAFFIRGYDPGNVLHFLGSSLDLFTLWYLALTATSASLFCKQDRRSTFLLAGGLWLVLSLCSFLSTTSFAFVL